MSTGKKITAELSTLSDYELFALLNQATDELRRQKLTHSGNNPVADYAELLTCRALGLTPAPKSTKGHDAYDSNGIRYEVKTRRETAQSKVTQFGGLRGLETRQIDRLVLVVFAEDFNVKRGLLLPYDYSESIAVYKQHDSKWVVLNDAKLGHPAIQDITSRLREQVGRHS